MVARLHLTCLVVVVVLVLVCFVFCVLFCQEWVPDCAGVFCGRGELLQRGVGTGGAATCPVGATAKDKGRDWMCQALENQRGRVCAWYL